MLYALIGICVILVCLVIYFAYQLKGDNSAYHQKLKQAEDEYNTKREQLSQNFSFEVQKVNEKIQLLEAQYQEQASAKYIDIQTLQNTLTYYQDLESAVIQKWKATEEQEKKKDYYRVILSDQDKRDIEKLKTIAPQISKPIILYKLIYECYYKQAFESLIKRIIGDDKNAGGIYKITNIDSNKTYIGRTTNFVKRWRDHAKCGVGADSGAQLRNKLYTEMQDKGLENFTFEILDVCSDEVQQEREKYWISFYKSTDYGYNTVSGG